MIWEMQLETCLWSVSCCPKKSPKPKRCTPKSQQFAPVIYPHQKDQASVSELKCAAARVVRRISTEQFLEQVLLLSPPVQAEAVPKGLWSTCMEAENLTLIQLGDYWNTV